MKHSTGIGLYPGTFDPVHAGHIAFARAAQKEAGLSRVVFLPEPVPRGKNNVSPLATRIAALQKAIAPHQGLEVEQTLSRQFTISQTLPQLSALFPGRRLHILIGSDVAAGLSYWPDVEVLLAEMPVIVGLRGETDSAAAEQSLTAVYARHGLVPVFKILRAPGSHLSSSQFRRQ